MNPNFYQYKSSVETSKLDSYCIQNLHILPFTIAITCGENSQRILISVLNVPYL